jgi:pimeloyl-ACP methyl ester carboxylesterase
MIVWVMSLVVVPVAAQESLPRFEAGRCSFPTPPEQEVECGDLIVLENRNNPESGTIALAVAIVRSPNADKAADPLVYLEGGPGGSSLLSTATVFNTTLAPFLADRDVILFDQRGVGLSNPSLGCPSFVDYVRESLVGNFSLEEEQAAIADALATCAAELTEEGYDLSAYNSAQNAADVADLATALGYEQINIFGTSYGSRLALTILRDHPEVVRSAVIGAVVGPQDDFSVDTIGFTDRVLNVLFDDCAADAACNAAYPNLREVFYELVAAWNAEPVTIDVIDPIAGEAVPMLINGDELVGGLFRTLYGTDLLPTLPRAIYAASEGDYSQISLFFTITIATEQIVSRGMYFAVNCREEYPFTPPGAYAAAAAALPALESSFLRLGEPDTICTAWDTGTADAIENEPVTSAVPTLLLSGEYDPITPPENGDEAASFLSNSTHIVFPGMSHDAALQACPVAISLAFLNDPAAPLDTACVDALPGVVFAVPGAVIDLVEFTSPASGLTGLRPATWTETDAAPGVYINPANPIQNLIVQSIPGATIDQFSRVLAGQLGLDTLPEPSEIREANGLNWNIYATEIQSLPAQIALAEHPAGVYFVVLVGTAGDFDDLVTQVFDPLIESLRPAG